VSGSKAREARQGIRPRFTWIVTLRHLLNNAVEEVEYSAYWSPDKLEPEEVGTACAAETNVFGPRDDAGNPRDPVEAIATRLKAA
jgi:hypothetical protein